MIFIFKKRRQVERIKPSKFINYVIIMSVRFSDVNLINVKELWCISEDYSNQLILAKRTIFYSNNIIYKF